MRSLDEPACVAVSGPGTLLRDDTVEKSRVRRSVTPRASILADGWTRVVGTPPMTRHASRNESIQMEGRIPGSRPTGWGHNPSGTGAESPLPHGSTRRVVHTYARFRGTECRIHAPMPSSGMWLDLWTHGRVLALLPERSTAETESRDASSAPRLPALAWANPRQRVTRPRATWSRRCPGRAGPRRQARGRSPRCSGARRSGY